MAGDGSAVRDALIALRYLGDSLDRMHGSMGADMDMNSTDLRALRMMIVREHRGEAVSPHDLARHLYISTASTTKLVDRLVAAGHVERHPHPRDRRARVLTLTPHARSEFFSHFGRRLGEMREVAETFDADELAAITRFLVEISDVVDRL